MKISNITKYLDSHEFVHKVHKALPLVVIGGGGAFALRDTLKHAPKEKDDRKKHFIRNTIIAAATMGAVLWSSRGHHHCCHNHADLKHIWDLSKQGLIAVAGGAVGGIIGDKVTGMNTKRSTSDKLKEGMFQFLANIALCNVGAAAALGGAKLLEHKGIINAPTKLQKMGIMLAGIIGMGIVGGSAIANYIGKKVINPIFGRGDNGKIYDERKPETLDVMLHVDDVAVAGVVSGFKWIEPLIPFFYFVSGYRTGIGYRNGEDGCTHIKFPNPFKPKTMEQFAQQEIKQAA